MLLCRISCELAGCVHQPIVGSGQTNLSHLYFSRLSLAMPAMLNFFKTPTSVRLVQVGPCPLPLEYQAATSHTGRQPCRVKSLYMKRFWCEPQSTYLQYMEVKGCSLVYVACHSLLLVMSTISKRKQKRSDIEAYYRNESKTFWFGPLKIGREAERFGLVRILCIKSSSFPFWPIGSGTKRTNLIWSKNCRRRSGTFLCNKKTYRSKQKVLIWFPYYWNESKTFWFGLLVFRTEAKYFDLVCFLYELKQNVLL